MTMHSVRAALRALRSIERSEVAWMCDLEWQVFSADPCGFWDECSESKAFVFWSIIQARNTTAAVRTRKRAETPRSDMVVEMEEAREAAEKEASE